MSGNNISDVFFQINYICGFWFVVGVMFKGDIIKTMCNFTSFRIGHKAIVRMEMINHYIISINHSAPHFECIFQRFDGDVLVCCRFGNGIVIATKCDGHDRLPIVVPCAVV